MPDQIPRIIVGPPSIEVVETDDPNVLGWVLSECWYGVVCAEGLAIASDGMRFDPRTLVINEDGSATARRVT